MAAMWGEGNRRGRHVETNKFNTLLIRGAHLGRMTPPVVLYKWFGLAMFLSYPSGRAHLFSVWNPGYYLSLCLLAANRRRGRLLLYLEACGKPHLYTCFQVSM
jgi:hypothetical protein